MDKHLIPAEVIPPGEFIRDELEERGWTQADLAEILGRPVQVVNEILAGKKGITPDTARELAAAFDVSPEWFLRLENVYRLSLAKKETTPVSRRARLYAKVPIRELIKRGWIVGSSDIAVLERQVCEFLGISSLDEESNCAFAARKGDGYEGVSPGQVAWFCRCKHLAKQRLARGRYSESALPDALARLPREFAEAQKLAELPERLSRLGVVLILLEHLPRTKIDGAAFWLEGRPIVALSVRYDRVDAFWFTLLHELAHILLHRNRTEIDVDLVGPHCEDSGYKPSEEREADRHACEWLVPTTELNRFIAETKPYYSHDRIVRFAEQLGIHPGIVVGQLQYRQEIGYGHSRVYLVKVRHYLPVES
jgi:HTH-type transcriptional regulator/antitoxin HigA